MRISDWSSDVCSSDLQLGEVGFGILRLTVIIPTLHPQLASNAFVWRRGQSVADEHDLPHYGLQSDASLKSPVLRIFAGQGGIRPRLGGGSEARRVGTAGVRTCGSRWSPAHSNKKHNQNRNKQ